MSLLLLLLLLRVRLLLLLLRVLLLRLWIRLRGRRRNTWSTKQMTSGAVFERLSAHRVLQRDEVIHHVFGALITLLRSTLATTHHDRGKTLGDAILPSRIERLSVRHQLRSRQFRVLRVAENVSPRDGAIEHRAHGIQIGGRGHVARVQDLLGRHVFERAEGHVRSSEVCLFQILARAGFNTAHAEIHHDAAHLPVGLRLHDDVAGLHIAMNDVRAVQIAKRPRHIATQIDRFFDRQSALMEDLRKRNSFDVLHHEDKTDLRIFDEVDDTSDVIAANTSQ